MRFATVVVALFGAASASAALVARQSPYPACANDCIANANYGTCAVTDTACLCASPAFVSGTTTCIQSACQGDDLTSAQQVGQALCAAVGVTLTSAAPSGTASASASGSATGSAAASGSSASATSPATSKASSSASSSAAATTSSSAANANGVSAVLGVAAIAVAALAL